MFQDVDVCVEPAFNFAYPGLHHHSPHISQWNDLLLVAVSGEQTWSLTTESSDIEGSWLLASPMQRGTWRFPSMSEYFPVSDVSQSLERARGGASVSWCFSGWAGNSHVFKKREPSLPAPLRQMSHNLLLLLSLFYLKLTLSDVKEMLHIWNTLEVNYNTYFLLCLCRETSMCCHFECR